MRVQVLPEPAANARVLDGLAIVEVALEDFFRAHDNVRTPDKDGRQWCATADMFKRRPAKVNCATLRGAVGGQGES